MIITREDRTEKPQLQFFSPVKRLITSVELHDYQARPGLKIVYFKEPQPAFVFSPAPAFARFS